MYNSAVLYDKSKTIVEEAFTVNPNKRKGLLFSDQKGLEQCRKLVDELLAQGVSFEVYYLAGANDSSGGMEAFQSLPQGTVIRCECDDSEIARIFNSQKMGTQLYIAGVWETAERIFPLASEAGFEEEEIQVWVSGPKGRNVYCMKCFQLSPIGEKDEEVQCPHCRAKMIVSDVHFSRVRKGYIGYLLPADVTN